MAKKKPKKLSKILTENFWSIWLLAILSIFLIFNNYRDSLAGFAWQKYRFPKTALLLNRGNADLAMLIGNYYFNGVIGSKEYNLGIAEKAFEKAVKINSKILWGHYQLARVYFVKGNYDMALEEIAKELEANPANLRSLYARGLIYGYRGQAGDLEKAEEDFRRFTYWAPKEWAGYNDLSWVLAKKRKYREAKESIIAAFREIPAEKDKNPWLWNSLGVAELNLEKYLFAEESFKHALELSKNLNLSEWRNSYPGNNPNDAESGLKAFREAVYKNLKRAKQGVDN